jgi:hypothetical protein
MARKSKELEQAVAVRNKPLRRALPEKCKECKGKPKSTHEKALSGLGMIVCDECWEVLKWGHLKGESKKTGSKRTTKPKVSKEPVNLKDLMKSNNNG